MISSIQLSRRRIISGKTKINGVFFTRKIRITFVEVLKEIEIRLINLESNFKKRVPFNSFEAFLKNKCLNKSSGNSAMINKN